MENQQVENIDDVVDRVNLVTRQSKKGNPYKVCQIVLSNGLECEVFLERAEIKIIEMLLQGAKK